MPATCRHCGSALPDTSTREQQWAATVCACVSCAAERHAAACAFIRALDVCLELAWLADRGHASAGQVTNLLAPHRGGLRSAQVRYIDASREKAPTTNKGDMS